MFMLLRRELLGSSGERGRRRERSQPPELPCRRLLAVTGGQIQIVPRTILTLVECCIRGVDLRESLACVSRMSGRSRGRGRPPIRTRGIEEFSGTSQAPNVEADAPQAPDVEADAPQAHEERGAGPQNLLGELTLLLRNLVGTSTNVTAAPAEGSKATALKEFKQENPPIFTGGSNPAEAENWLQEMNHLFEIIGTPPEFKVRFAIRQLRVPALNWWRTLKENQDVSTLNWDGFTKLVKDNYIRSAYRNVKAEEFYRLVQRDMSVHEYAAKFVELLPYAGSMASSEEDQCRKFERGLKLEIREKLLVLQINKMSELVEKAFWCEQGMMDINRSMQRMNQRGRGFRQGQSSRSGRNSGQNSGYIQGQSSGSYQQPQYGQGQPSGFGQGGYGPQRKGKGGGSGNSQSGSSSSSGSKSRGSPYPDSSHGVWRTRAGESGRNRCFECGEEGHKRKDCPRKTEGQSQPKQFQYPQFQQYPQYQQYPQPSFYPPQQAQQQPYQQQQQHQPQSNFQQNQFRPLNPNPRTIQSPQTSQGTQQASSSRQSQGRQNRGGGRGPAGQGRAFALIPPNTGQANEVVEDPDSPEDYPYAR